MQNKKINIKSILVYFVGNVFSKIVTFLLLPIITKNIPTNDYGIYDSSIAIITLFSSFLFLDVGSGVMKYIFDSKVKKGSIVKTGYYIFGISTTIYFLIGIISCFLFDVKYIFLVILYGYLTSYLSFISYIARAYKYNSLYAISGGVSTLINVFLSLLLILVFNFDYSALYVSAIAGTLVQILMLECKTKSIKTGFTSNFDKQNFISLLKFCLPLCLNSIGYWVMTSLNKVLVTYLISAEANGIYAMATKFTSIIYLFSSCVQLAWQELAYSLNNDDDIGEYYYAATKMYMKFLMIGNVIVLPLISIIYPLLIDNSYLESKMYVVFSVLGTSLCILNSFMGSIFGAIKKTLTIMLSTILGAILNVICVLVLIKFNFGIQSANYGFILGFITSILIRYLILKKEIKYKFPWVYFISLIIIDICIYFVFNKPIVINILVFILGCLLSIILLWKDIMIIVKKRSCL